MRSGTIVAQRFCLEEKLGVGGFGAVWSALDQRSGARVAVKISSCESLRVAWRRGVFDRETAALRHLDHPSIVRWLDTFATDEFACLVMELAEGETLARSIGRRVASGSHYTLDEVASMVTVMSEAVAYAHAHGVVHRDLKTPNVISGAGGFKLLDFGIAKLRDGVQDEDTTQGRALGTLSQLTPEQILGKPVDERVDVYGLGCVAFELLTLHVPWVNGPDGPAVRDAAGSLRMERERESEMVYYIARGPRPRLTPYRSDITPEIEAVIHTALAIDVEQRTPSARAFGEALARAIASLPAEVRSIAPPWVPAVPRAEVVEDIRFDSLLASETPQVGPPPMIEVLRDSPGVLTERTTIGEHSMIAKTIDVGPRSSYEIGAALDAWIGVEVPGVARLLSHAPDPEVPQRWRLMFENVEGTPLSVILAQYAASGRTLGREHVVELFDRLAAPIEALHARGLIHGALHYGNALVLADGRVVWTDAGWVDALGLSDAPVTMAGDILQLGLRFIELAGLCPPGAAPFPAKLESVCALREYVQATFSAASILASETPTPESFAVTLGPTSAIPLPPTSPRSPRLLRIAATFAGVLTLTALLARMVL